jgi:Cu-Zn family superoxide dismutase
MNMQLGIMTVGMLALGAAAAVDAGVVASHSNPTAEAKMVNAKGEALGTVVLEQTTNGLILKGSLKGVTPGAHGLHVHQVGKCEAPFKSAGDHFNPLSRLHGERSDGGVHAGDLPNLVVPADGQVSFEIFAPGLTLTTGAGAVLDTDGSALVLHAKADDYISQPAGNAGDRVACGVITKH